MDGFEDVVFAYCLSYSTQLGFQLFAPHKARGKKELLWHPSAVFIAAETLAAALRDVAGRMSTLAAAGTPSSLAPLACAVRELYMLVFQPYGTWLRTVRLRRPAFMPASRSAPDAKSLHIELSELCLYWLIYSEGANLRHTPEMLWFIFYCAQHSWQAKEVLLHLEAYADNVYGLPQQQWVQERGPGLARAAVALHAEQWRATKTAVPTTGLDQNGNAKAFPLIQVMVVGSGPSPAASKRPSSASSTSAASGGRSGSDVQATRDSIAVRRRLDQQPDQQAGNAKAALVPQPQPGPAWDARAAPAGIGELLARLCPNEAAVATALQGCCSEEAAAAPEGDATLFLSRVVQPLFLFLSEQVYELGQARRQGLESAVRIAYDDVNESMAHPGVVAAALAALPWATASTATAGSDGGAASEQQLPWWRGGGPLRPSGMAQPAAPGAMPSAATLQRMPSAAVHEAELYWSRLLALGDLLLPSAARIPWSGDMHHYRAQLLALLHGSPAHARSGGAKGSRRRGPAGSDPVAGEDEETSATVDEAAQLEVEAKAVSPAAAAAVQSLRRANAAADWWCRHVLRKTFTEHRNVAMPLVSFGRVFQFQLIWFYLLCAWSWPQTYGLDNMPYIAAAAAVHWGSVCIVDTLQVLLAAGARMKRARVPVPLYCASEGAPLKGSGPAAPVRPQTLRWWCFQLGVLTVCWGLLLGGVYVFFVVWPEHDFLGLQCYDLFWGQSCYWWLAVGYSGYLLLYQGVYRHLTLSGGYARAPLTDRVATPLRLGTGLGSASGALGTPAGMYSACTNLRTGPDYFLGNAALWLFALGLKFAVDYYILVKPAAERVADILQTDKLGWGFTVNWGWWPAGWTRHFQVDVDPLLVGVQVLVLFLLSLVSCGVSYSIATAIYGALQGVHQRVGSVRSWRHIRAGFHCTQAAMRSKLLQPELELPPRSGFWLWRALRAAGRLLLALLLLPLRLGAELLRSVGCMPPDSGKPRSWVERENTMAVTAPFWNALVKSLRGRDLLTDKEAAALSFTAVSLSPASMIATFKSPALATTSRRSTASSGGEPFADWVPRETYLPPVAVFVAQIPQMVFTNSASAAQQEVCQEAYLYFMHLMVAVNIIPRSAPDKSEPGQEAGPGFCPDLHKDKFHPDSFAKLRPRASTHSALAARRELLAAVVAVVKGLLDTAGVYKDTAGGCGREAGEAEQAAARAARAAAIDKLCMALHATARCMTKMHDLPWSVSVIMNRVVVRQHYHTAPVKASLDRGFAGLTASRADATAWRAQHVPSHEDFTKVASWLLAILRPSDEGTSPSNAEAVELLADFCSGLHCPHLPPAPRVAAMRAVSTLIPHYQETVLYALSSSDARKVLAAAGAPALEGGLAEDEVMFRNDDGAPSELLQYLVSEFPDELRNLMERCKALVPLQPGEMAYTLDDFLPYGRLHEHRAQLLLWASFRGQVLARTVDGMSMYRLALAMQAVQDAMVPASRHPSPHGSPLKARTPTPGLGLRLSQAQRLLVRGTLRDPNMCVEELVAQLIDVVPGLADLLDQKYSLVVSSQVFSKMAASKSLADRWRAHGVALLATRYPALRVAYLEQVGAGATTLFKAPDFAYSAARQASVLIRATPVAAELAALQAARDGHGAGADVPTLAVGLGAGPGGSTPLSRLVEECESEHGAEGYELGDLDDGDAELRLWRRRHLLLGLRACELEVVFRQLLPINYYDMGSGAGVILGEGKPENQNSAVIYCTGTLLQTIDMNQDNTLAQSFKLRNTTREFAPLGAGLQQQHVAVVGYPEWIFSYRCGLLADLAAATERTFGTQIQRVMAHPSAVRAHYGHPDLWNRLFAMTRGGFSKPNAAQHVSEDVFGGYNALKRGGLSKYVSYISVGKGRDMGLDSILGFEGKISKGCGEQLMSRDVRFLGTHMDFFRCMSFYHTGPGHFVNTALTVTTIWLGVWVQLVLLLAGVNASSDSVSTAMGSVQILQLGTLPLLGYLFNLWTEGGLAAALGTLCRQFVAGGLLFHIFRSVTSAFHLGRAMLFGGASYVATGRGFSLKRKSLTQVYYNYGRSHLYLGADLFIMVLIILVYGNNGGNGGTPVPASAMWSPLLVCAALLAGPFWFTPFFFRLSQVLRDTSEFRAWINGSNARGVAEGWAEWNAQQLAQLRDDARVQVPSYRFWSTFCLVMPKAAVTVLSSLMAITGAHFESDLLPDLWWVLGGSAVGWVLFALWGTAKRAYISSGLAPMWRWAKGAVQIVGVGLLLTLLVVILFLPHKGVRFAGVLVTLYANYQIASLVVLVCVVWLPRTMWTRSLSNAAYRHADSVLGLALAACLIVICFIGEIGLIMVDRVQTLVQFNDRYSHSAAAKPYGDGDDSAGGAGGGGGGGGHVGLAAAAAAALRRRTPSHINLAALMRQMAGAPTSTHGQASTTHGSNTPTRPGWATPAALAAGMRHDGSSAAPPSRAISSLSVGMVQPDLRSRACSASTQHAPPLSPYQKSWSSFNASRDASYAAGAMVVSEAGSAGSVASGAGLPPAPGSPGLDGMVTLWPGEIQPDPSGSGWTTNTPGASPPFATRPASGSTGGSSSHQLLPVTKGWSDAAAAAAQVAASRRHTDTGVRRLSAGGAVPSISDSDGLGPEVAAATTAAASEDSFGARRYSPGGVGARSASSAGSASMWRPGPLNSVFGSAMTAASSAAGSGTPPPPLPPRASVPPASGGQRPPGTVQAPSASSGSGSVRLGSVGSAMSATLRPASPVYSRQASRQAPLEQPAPTAASADSSRRSSGNGGPARGRVPVPAPIGPLTGMLRAVVEASRVAAAAENAPANAASGRGSGGGPAPRPSAAVAQLPLAPAAPSLLLPPPVQWAAAQRQGQGGRYSDQASSIGGATIRSVTKDEYE